MGRERIYHVHVGDGDAQVSRQASDCLLVRGSAPEPLGVKGFLLGGRWEPRRRGEEEREGEPDDRKREAREKDRGPGTRRWTRELADVAMAEAAAPRFPCTYAYARLLPPAQPSRSRRPVLSPMSRVVVSSLKTADDARP